jgi:hypothetical protein
VIQKEAEKKLKYKNLRVEIQQMWNMKFFVIPVITGATGVVRTTFNRFCTKKIHIRNITYHKESATI